MSRTDKTISIKGDKAKAAKAKTASGKAIKFLRVAIYLIAIPALALGVGLIKNSTLSSSYADGTAEAKIQNGAPIFFVALIILSANIIWGILRWFLKAYTEKWRVRKIVGKTLGAFIWRTLVFSLLFIIALFVFTPLATTAIANNLKTEEEVPYNPDETLARLEYLNNNFDNLSREEIESELEELTLQNIDFDPDYKQPTSRKLQNPFVNSVKATTHKVSMLTKAKLSSKSNFVVFYTDQGDDAITEEEAENLAAMLESIVEGYKQKLGFDYEYHKIGVGIFKASGIKKVLKASGLDENLLDTAMPVYVANPFSGESNVLASYAGDVFAKAWAQIALKLGKGGDDMFKFYDSAPSFPFINIGPASASSDDIAIVTAHELGHHYAHTYSKNNFGEDGSTDDFIDETAPNWMAINVLPNQPEKNTVNGGHYNKIYLSNGTNLTAGRVVPGCGSTDPGDSSACNGYPFVALLENYYEIVPDGKTKIMNALHNGDALNHLYSDAGSDNFQKVMTALAEKNLTGDYSGKLTNYITPPGETLPCSDLCSHTFSINPAATNYVYFAAEEYENTKIAFESNNPETTANLLGKTFSGAWEILESAARGLSHEIGEEPSHELFAFAVSNASISENHDYTVSVLKTDLEEVVAEDGNFNFEMPSGELFASLGNGCYRINFAYAIDAVNQFIGLGSEFLGVISQFDDSGQIAEIKTQYDAETVATREQLNEAKTALDPYEITLCFSFVDKNLSFATAKSKLQSSPSHTVNLYNGTANGLEISAFVGFDLFSRQAKGYLLLGDGHDLGLLTISLAPR